jgi:hypothetical protein
VIAHSAASYLTAAAILVYNRLAGFVVAPLMSDGWFTFRWLLVAPREHPRQSRAVFRRLGGRSGGPASLL